MKALFTTPGTVRASGRWTVPIAIVVWIGSVAAAAAWVSYHDFAINAPAKAKIVDHWPQTSALARNEERATLVVFLHPKCPCSRASLHELSELLDSVRGATETMPELIVDATVPQSADASWYDTDTMASAQKLMGANVFVDHGGVEASRFGAATSGLVMLFDAAGVRRYAGGITGSRGHEGANTGRDCVERLLRGDHTVAREIPTFGCRLCLPENSPNNATSTTSAE